MAASFRTGGDDVIPCRRDLVARLRRPSGHSHPWCTAELVGERDARGLRGCGDGMRIGVRTPLLTSNGVCAIPTGHGWCQPARQVTACTSPLQRVSRSVVVPLVGVPATVGRQHRWLERTCSR